MATTSPPGPPAAPPPPGAPVPAPHVRAPRTGQARIAAVGALALVVLIVAYLVFAPWGGASYKLEFAEADQLVRGDQVQVGGVPVGSVTNIELTARLQGGHHDPRRLLADPAAPGHVAQCGCPR